MRISGIIAHTTLNKTEYLVIETDKLRTYLPTSTWLMNIFTDKAVEVIFSTRRIPFRKNIILKVKLTDWDKIYDIESAVEYGTVGKIFYTIQLCNRGIMQLFEGKIPKKIYIYRR